MRDINELSFRIPLLFEKNIKNLEKRQSDVANKIYSDIIEKAPKKTRQYISSIKVGKTTNNNGVITTKIYTDMCVETLDGKIYNLGKLLENGTKSHKIVATRSKVLTDGVNFYGKVVNHPGTIAQPHFIPSLQKNKEYYKKQIIKAMVGR